MNTRPEVTVTSATGHIGGLVAHLLAEQEVPLKLLVRDRSSTHIPEIAETNIHVAHYGEFDQCVRALVGTQSLLMVSAAESADRVDQHRIFIDAARTADVQHVVYTSFFGASDDATFTLARDHAATEAHLKASGLSHTILRDNLYLDFLPLLAGEDGVIRGPASDGKVSAVARSDIARCAASVLLSPDDHCGVTYDLTGREALGLADVAEIVSTATGIATSYYDESLEEAFASRSTYGAPDWQVEAWVSTYTAIAAGELAAVTDDVENLIGRPPMTLTELLAR